MTNPIDHDDDTIRYGLTMLGREALAEGIADAIGDLAAPSMDPAVPLIRIRRSRSRVRALVRAVGRRG